MNDTQARASTLVICNQRGLHARAAAKFVKCVSQYKADVTVTRDGTTVSGQSIMGLMMLAAALGSEIKVEARGPEAGAVLVALKALVECGFEEGIATP